MKCFHGLLYMGLYGAYIFLYRIKLWPKMTIKMTKILSDHSSLAQYDYHGTIIWARIIVSLDYIDFYQTCPDDSFVIYQYNNEQKRERNI